MRKRSHIRCAKTLRAGDSRLFSSASQSKGAAESWYQPPANRQSMLLTRIIHFSLRRGLFILILVSV
ncbi:MAG TPA: hypothetical protein VE242_03180, partial [Chthoniobacterales bacterium]|nr:hypothetical protein [Chthoniobacterales bacterium]